MRKFVIGILAATSILAVSVPAFAGWVDGYGYYHPYCYSVWGQYGWTTACY
jgi:hypothetical protein